MLGYDVLRYINRVRQRPSDAGDPTLLNILEKKAKEAFEGVVALTAPASPMTWETVQLLTGGVQQTNRQSFRFPRPVEIVGFHPTLVILATGGAITPSLDTVAVQIDTDNQNYLTSGEGLSTPAGGKAGAFVTLSAMSVQVPRLVGYKLRNPTPDIGFTLRWKQDTTIGAPVYHDCLVSIAMFARYI